MNLLSQDCSAAVVTIDCDDFEILELIPTLTRQLEQFFRLSGTNSFSLWLLPICLSQQKCCVSIFYGPQKQTATFDFLSLKHNQTNNSQTCRDDRPDVEISVAVYLCVQNGVHSTRKHSIVYPKSTCSLIHHKTNQQCSSSPLTCWRSFVPHRKGISKMDAMLPRRSSSRGTTNVFSYAEH